MSITHTLSNSPPIVENIFKHLCSRDLSSCAQVCSFWYRMSLTEKSRRQVIKWFFEVESCNRDSSDDDISRECNPEDQKLGSVLQEKISNLRIQPTFCLAFVSSHLYEHFEVILSNLKPLQPERKKTKRSEIQKQIKCLNKAINTYLKPHLPTQCQVSCVVSSGIIGCHSDFGAVEIEVAPAITGFFFPNFQGMQVHHIVIDDDNFDESNLITQYGPVKCLLMFITSDGVFSIKKLINNCASKGECRLAVGGALVDQTESGLGSVFAFCGENVEAASVIIGSDVTKEELASKLEVFRGTGLLENHCIAFMFACIRRGFYYYKEDNIESRAFCKLYPNVPLFGVFGNGEIGMPYLPNVPTPEKGPKKKSKKYSVLKHLHSYTTVFVLISVKK